MEKKVENKVVVGEDGTIYVEVATEVSEEDVKELLDKIEEGLRFTGKGTNVFVNVATTVVIRSSKFRKETADRIKDIFNKYEFGKVSLLTQSLATRTIVSFIVAVTKLSNIRVFKSEEEAVRWLKE